jgi:hypothetical protein
MLVYRALTYALPQVNGAVACVILRVTRRKEVREPAKAEASPSGGVTSG